MFGVVSAILVCQLSITTTPPAGASGRQEPESVASTTPCDGAAQGIVAPAPSQRIRLIPHAWVAAPSFSRLGIWQSSSQSHSGKQHPVLIGAGIGVGVGGAWGGVNGNLTDQWGGRGGSVLLGAAIGAGVGSLVGLVVGMAR